MKTMYLFIAAVIAMLVLSFTGCNHRSRGRYFDSTLPHYVPRPRLVLWTARPA